MKKEFTKETKPQPITSGEGISRTDWADPVKTVKTSTGPKVACGY